RELRLEGLELVAHRERARAGHAPDDLEQLLEQDRVGLVEPGDRDGGGGGTEHRHQAAALPATVGPHCISASALRRAPRPRWCRPWIDGSVRPRRPAISPGLRPTRWRRTITS